MSETEDLRGKVALVTGASSGIGEAIAEALALRGVRVTLAARRVDRLQALAERIAQLASQGASEGQAPGETLTVACDVREESQVEDAVRKTTERWGQLDILIANAGFGYRKPTVDGDPARWKAMIDTNVYGLLLTLKHGVKPMLERKRGHIVVMSSIAGVVTTPGGGAYCGSKAAASAITDALRMEVGPQGVAVTAIEPGVVISEFQEVAEYTPDIVANMLKGATPLYPPDVARAVIFACEQPENATVGELIIRPRGQAYP
ncbi:MAG TPA: SDR family oxidoreductase [Ktedonobacterales bacterium]|jgi:NADP-dependent 3-hydroxy acid dehydrogenase YdfG|nr:SDR family oxidoreductase [Ktedonobacterales bacterium]